MRPSPASRRSMTSPRLRQSQRRLESGMESGFMVNQYFSSLWRGRSGSGQVLSGSGRMQDRIQEASYRLGLFEIARQRRGLRCEEWEAARTAGGIIEGAGTL